MIDYIAADILNLFLWWGQDTKGYFVIEIP